MKNYLLIILALILSSNTLNAQEKFSAMNSEGITLYYEVLDATNQIVKIGKSPNNDQYCGVINIPKSVAYNNKIYRITDIGFAAFDHCTSLRVLNIPNSVTTIHSFAFTGCKSLVSITLGDSLTSIGSFAFNECSSLISITLPKTLSEIGGQAFKGCTALSNITILNPIDSYITRNKIFENCTHIKSITFGHYISTIPDEVFDSCTALTHINLASIKPPIITEKTFNNIPKDIPIYVPCNAINLYLNDANWSQFTNIQCNNSTNHHNELTVYPNPTTGPIRISSYDIETIEVLKSDGEKVTQFKGQQKIDISNLEKGNYTLKITTSKGTSTHEIIKK